MAFHDQDPCYLAALFLAKDLEALGAISVDLTSRVDTRFYMLTAHLLAWA